MRKLILIKHARPQVQENQPPETWPLSEEGRTACVKLADVVRPLDPAIIVTSEETKAHETGQILSAALGKPLEAVAELGEHDRGNVPIMRSGEFLSAMANFFKQRRRLVLGRETADEAAARFRDAVYEVVNRNPDGNVAIVTHGTVLALFASECGSGDPFQLYREFGLPSVMVFSVPEYEEIERHPKIGS